MANLILKLINTQKKRFKNFKSDKEEYDIDKLKYEDLAPKDELKKGEEAYISALDWALSQDKVHNIALTGPYGAGKSTILRAYENKRRHYKYLYISLASFYDTNVLQKGNEKLVDFDDQDIEKSILKQIFYKVKASKIPYSRFRKIKNISFVKTAITLLSAIIALIGSCILISPKFIDKFKDNLNTLNTHGINNNFAYALYIILMIVTSIVGAGIIHYFSAKLHISKLSVDKLGIEKDKANDESAFNKYLDEILYYFEVTKYDVVFIEDLDRFNNPKIFIKLRELNSLINNSEQINKKVVFIYAIKDDMFKDKDRTKFFEYIVPVIPIIDVSNSCEKLQEKLEKAGCKDNIKMEYINGISVYINDMRTVINVCNEFQIYKKVLTDINLKDEKMFFIIAYKNLYPNDFAKLQHREGLVYNAIKKVKITETLRKKRFEMEELLKNNDSDISKSLKELKAALLYSMLGNFYEITQISFYNNKQYDYSLQDFMKDDFDLELIEDKPLKIKYNRYYATAENIQTSLKDADSKSSSDKTYIERWKNLKELNSKGKEKIKEEIKENRKKASELQSKRLCDLFKEYNIDEILSEDIIKEKPIVYLL